MVRKGYVIIYESKMNKGARMGETSQTTCRVTPTWGVGVRVQNNLVWGNLWLGVLGVEAVCVGVVCM